MKGTILEKIIERKRERIEVAKRQTDSHTIADRAHSCRAHAERHQLESVLADRSRVNIIAEFKRASPSKGVINDVLDPAATAIKYQNGGACAISVLTEEDFFKGSLDDLRAIRKAVSLPILRKDFIVNEFQIYEAALVGADAVLLIVAALTEENLNDFLRLAQDDLGMDALVEVHTSEEFEIATKISASIIGVNNRDLKTFGVSLDVSRRLIAKKPAGSLMIAESGIVSKEEMVELRSLGFDGFLVGETLMRSGNPRTALEEWV